MKELEATIPIRPIKSSPCRGWEKVRTTHELKIWPEYFGKVWNGRMRFQLRRNDRDFQVGDQLLLKEYRPDPGVDLVEFGYTGRELLVRVDFIMRAEDTTFGSAWAKISIGYIIMSISHVN